MGVKLCLEPGCWEATAGSRCTVHEAAWQRARNLRRGTGRTPQAPYRKVSLVGQACWCCGATEDLTRHHLEPLANAFHGEGVLVPMCRRCNSSIGTKRMAGLACPMHGGAEA